MIDQNIPRPGIRVDSRKLREFAAHVLIGIGFVAIWILLACVGVGGIGKLAVVGFTLISSLFHGDVWRMVLLGGVAAGLAIWVLWIAHEFALEFLEDIGVQITGPLQILVLPIALPLVVIGLSSGMLATLGQRPKSKGVAVVLAILGGLLSLAVAVVLLWVLL